MKHQESALAHKYLDRLEGLEIGGAAHNPFSLPNCLNVDYNSDMENNNKLYEYGICGEKMRVDIVASGDDLLFDDNSKQYIVSSHVIEHFFDPIKTLREWERVVCPGGYIFIICPHVDRVEKETRPITTLQELIDRHEGRIVPLDIDMGDYNKGRPDMNHGHFSIWNTESFLELCKYLNMNVIECHDRDDKVGNGFTVVIKKEGIMGEIPLDKYPGQTAWIVGKGPSLQYIRSEDFGDGPVIAINESIIKIEQLRLHNPVYSQQKDGGGQKPPTVEVFSPECEHRGECGDACGNIGRPKDAILLVHSHESKYCFEDYSPRHVLSWEELGMPGNRCSMVFAIHIAKQMGCTKLKFLCFDAHTKGDIRCYVPGTGIPRVEECYDDQRIEVEPFLEGLDIDWITPIRNRDFKPLVSICIPAFHHQYFRQALESAIDQNYENLEIIVCDDSKRNAIYNTFQSFIPQMKRLGIHHQFINNRSRLGVVGNFLKACAKCRGTYIKPLNDDDELTVDAVERMVVAFEANPSVKLVFGKRDMIDKDGSGIPGYPDFIFTGASPIGGIYLGNLIMAEGNYIGDISSFMFRRKDSNENAPTTMSLNGRAYKGFGDLALALYLLSSGDGYYIQETVNYSRQHDKQYRKTRDLNTRFDIITTWYYLFIDAIDTGFLKNVIQRRQSGTMVIQYLEMFKEEERARLLREQKMTINNMVNSIKTKVQE